MRCVITAGPTFEPLDRVRRLTNFSTGRLGAELARHLAEGGHEVLLLRGEMATWPAPAHPAIQLESFTTTSDLQQRLEALATAKTLAIFHAAAVSDFAFGRVYERGPRGELAEIRAGKFSTREGSLLAELVPTTKLVARLRGWFPDAWLVGWKYAVDGDRVSALREGAQQIAACHTDACVANGPAYGAGFGVIRADSPATTDCPDGASLFAALAALLTTPRS